MILFFVGAQEGPPIWLGIAVVVRNAMLRVLVYGRGVVVGHYRAVPWDEGERLTGYGAPAGALVIDTRLAAFATSIFFLRARRRAFILSKTIYMSVNNLPIREYDMLTFLDRLAVFIFQTVDLIGC